MELFPPKFGDQFIPALKWEDTYRYLGAEVGRPRSSTLDTLKQEVEDIVDKILTRLVED